MDRTRGTKCQRFGKRSRCLLRLLLFRWLVYQSAKLKQELIHPVCHGKHAATIMPRDMSKVAFGVSDDAVRSYVQVVLSISCPKYHAVSYVPSIDYGLHEHLHGLVQTQRIFDL